jgi:hypothetical protein
MLTTYAFVVTQPLWLRDPLHAEALRGLAKRLFEPWAHWDGVWFVRIASGGYRAHPAGAAFFPLYPLLVRGLMPLAFHNYVVAGVCVSLSCYAAAMLVLDRLVEQEAGSQIARGTVLLISVFPMAFFFQAVYSESLFLLLSLLSFWAGRRGRWGLAGAFGLLAALTRNSGLLLVAPLLVMWWEQRRAKALRLPGGPLATTPRARPPALRSLALLALVPAGLGLYALYLWRVLGQPFAFTTAQRDWGRSLSWPSTTLWRAFYYSGEALFGLARHTYGSLDGLSLSLHGVQRLSDLPEFCALLFAGWLIWVSWRRLPACYTLYALVACLFPLCFPEKSEPLASYPRLLAVNFPLFIALAGVLARHQRWRWPIIAVMASLSVIATAIFASFA